MKVAVLKGSAVATSAAFVWATYYVFVPLLHSLDPLTLFFYPSLFGFLLFLLFGLYSGGRIPLPSKKRDYLLPGMGYFASQILIIISTLANGGVLTSTFILLGDTVLSPSIVFALGRNRFRPRLRFLVVGLVVLILSAGMLTLFGGYVSLKSAEGILLLLLIPPSLSVFFVYTNERITDDGMAEILTPAFLVSSVFIVAYAFISGTAHPVEFGSAYDLFILFLIGATSMFVGYLLFFKASGMAGFTLSSILMALIPPFTMMLGVAFLGLRATPLSVSLIILAAVGASLCTVAFAEGGALSRSRA